MRFTPVQLVCGAAVPLPQCDLRCVGTKRVRLCHCVLTVCMFIYVCVLHAGACMTGAGPGPKESPSNPWPGTCGAGEMKGKGPNTYTSGFEGSWTQTPTKW